MKERLFKIGDHVTMVDPKVARVWAVTLPATVLEYLGPENGEHLCRISGANGDRHTFFEHRFKLAEPLPSPKPHPQLELF